MLITRNIWNHIDWSQHLKIYIYNVGIVYSIWIQPAGLSGAGLGFFVWYGALATSLQAQHKKITKLMKKAKTAIFRGYSL